MMGLVALVGCGGGAADPTNRADASDRVREPAPALIQPSISLPDKAGNAPASTIDGPTVVFLGDSLTAGLGLDVPQNFPSLIQQRLAAAGYAHRVVNAGVSGDTSAGGLRRLDWALAEGKPDVLVVGLGGNDGLRGLPPEQLEENLAAIIEHGQKRGVTVILAGMEAPPNFGADYTSRFRAVYPRLAERYGVTLIPFLLEGVAGVGSLNQADGIHPNARGAELLAELVWRRVEPALSKTAATPSR